MNPSMSPLPGLLTYVQGATADAVPCASTDERAVRLIEFALAERERIETLDVELGRIALQYDQPHAATAMRRMYQQWADQAGELVARLCEEGFAWKMPEPLNRLEYAIGRIRAMLSIALDDIRQGQQDFLTGNTFSIEEVRSELRAAARR